MKKLLESSTFNFGFMILLVAALAIIFTDPIVPDAGGRIMVSNPQALSWSDWLETAKWLLGIYASKEGIRYGASAYQARPGQ